jgi:hypothetical protein
MSEALQRALGKARADDEASMENLSKEMRRAGYTSAPLPRVMIHLASNETLSAMGFSDGVTEYGYVPLSEEFLQEYREAVFELQMVLSLNSPVTVKAYLYNLSTCATVPGSTAHTTSDHTHLLKSAPFSRKDLLAGGEMGDLLVSLRVEVGIDSYNQYWRENRLYIQSAFLVAKDP